MNTPWEPPNYTYIPNPIIPGASALFGGSTSSSAGGSDDGDSTMPPGATTPMFSPIPFLVRQGPENGGEVHIGMEGMEEIGHSNSRSLEDGLMSPLMLGGDSPNPSGGLRFAEPPNVRRPTPEPEEMVSSPPAREAESHDPGHQPYLGRVDELDTGPLTLSASAHVNGHKIRGDHEDPGVGSGEGGNMRPHGMSERPVPISSTTSIEEGERRIAGIPRGGLGDRFVTGASEDEHGS